jgi:hypothetical protein
MYSKHLAKSLFLKAYQEEEFAVIIVAPTFMTEKRMIVRQARAAYFRVYKCF